MQNAMTQMLKVLCKHKLVPVIQLDNVADALPLGEALLNSGLPIAEVTLRSSAALPAISLLAEKLPELLLIAGTVTTPSMAKNAMMAGAQMVVSPGYNPATVDFCCDSSIPIMPGVMTPGEIERALMMGLNAVKLFPAQAMGGTAMLKAMLGPYKELTVMPTGGISPDNLLDYLAIPQVCCCGGSWMVSSQLIKEGQWQQIEDAIKKAVALINSAQDEC